MAKPANTYTHGPLGLTTKTEVTALLDKCVEQLSDYQKSWNIHDKPDAKRERNIRFLEGQRSAYQAVLSLMVETEEQRSEERVE